MKYLVRDKLFAIGDDYWIEDEDGRHAFLVDGKALRLRDTLELKAPDGRVVITLREKLLSLRGAMTVERDERPLATVRRKRLSLLRNHYRVTMADGTELDVSGRILDREWRREEPRGPNPPRNPPGGRGPGPNTVDGARGGGSRSGVRPQDSPAQLLAHISRRWLRVRDTYAVDVVREDADAALLIAVAVCVIRMAERED
ncbi:LURP-one-related/scramblase family protein [Streptomyces hydrogenans]|uniref:LURP-one-related/scramblase family protein n=1 Tax=Streptomyces hydrogenans TaxID=1873719 RepID=UPI0035DC3BAA